MPRITPACAGKSADVEPPEDKPMDHPRVCGEKHLREVLGVKHRGSPPPVRGKGKEAGSYYKMNRITPACAGKSNRDCGGRSYRRDHPRLCGEKDT